MLFLSLLFFLPSQLGRHFWPEFAYLNGLRVDYLSPTLYLTDILLFLLFVETLPFFLRRLSRQSLTLVFVLLLWLGYFALTSLWPQNSFFGFLRLIEVVFFALCVSWFMGKISLREHARGVLAIALLYTALLSTLQFFKQGSVGGFWYYLGERTFTSTTPGIANAELAGDLILRPYATFPHPNVLAGFTVLMTTFLLVFPSNNNSKGKKILLTAAIFFGVITTILTLSRTGILVLGFVLVVWFFGFLSGSFKRFLLVFLSIAFLALFFKTGFFLRFSSLNLSHETVVVREFLINESLKVFQTNPIAGVGLQNFLPSLAQRLNPIAPLAFFQPVHSLYLLILSETGVVGLGMFLFLLFLTIQRIWLSEKKERLGKGTLLGAFLLLGLTDHYLYTLHQGQFLTAFVFGVAWMRRDSNESFTLQEGKNFGKETQRKKRCEQKS